jgi:hypothetical protein
MSHLRLLLCRVEDEQHPDQMTQLAAVDLPETQLSDLTQQTCLDTLEERTLQAGQALMGPLLEAQWNEVDTLLTQQIRQDFSPSLPQKGRTGSPEGGDAPGHPHPQAPSTLRSRRRHASGPR